MGTPLRDSSPILASATSKSATISKPSRRKPGIVGERQAEVTGTHHSHAQLSVKAQNLPEMPLEILDVVADAADAELAEIGQILADLRGIQMELLGQGLRRNRFDAGGFELSQAAQVNRQTIGGELGDLLSVGPTLVL